MANVSDRELREIVRAAIGEVLQEERPRKPWLDARAPQSAPKRPGQRPLPPPLSSTAIDAIKRSSPSRLAQGRTGTRYLTDNYVGLRADHAIALDAVNSSVPEAFVQEHNWLPLKSRCQDHEEFLLHPDHGRRLDDASRALLEQQGDKGIDIQLIAGDGLAAWALLQNGPPLLAALDSDLRQAGFSVGKPVFARFARVGIQDDIGVVLGAKATIILVGERPGLGTGDSLSIYTAYGPKLNQDNAEKDCISNVRTLGVSPAAASRQCTDLMKRTFEAGGGGISLI